MMKELRTGTSSVNPQTGDFTNLVKLSIVCEEEGNLLNQREEEECNNDKDGQNQIEVEEPNKILGDDINQIDSNKKNYLFDLNKKPEDEELEDY
uniref:Uncharacterized protein n=1 Tax=Meloidogyne enterolobii TaxID=390850 RepID=A0A6V7TVK5_MELEN|nr:unnamed protein product [Meloidogyne enterolobii]